MSPRLTLALDQGTLSFPDGGDILVDTPALSFDLTALDARRVIIRHGFWPDAEAWGARGYRVTQTRPERVAAAIVALPRAKDQARAMIAAAAGCSDGPVIVDGAKTDGVDSILKDVRKRCPVHGPVNKAHGKLFWLTRPDVLPEAVADWIAEPGETEDGFVTAPGMFSPDGADQGSEVLVALVPHLKGRVADLGAGWGYMSAVLLDEQESIAAMDLIEAEYAALQAARSNVDDPRARFFWADATVFEPEERYDAIISNPPFHTGRAADPALGQAFIAAVARMLKPSGQFFMVANQHLPYEATLKAHFGTGKLLAEIAGYKLYQAGKPKGVRRG